MQLKNTLKNYHKRLDHEDIDEFRLHLNQSFDKKLKTLQSQFDNASESDVDDPLHLEAYKNHLDDIMGNTYTSKMLGHELSIIALYKKVEIKTIRVIKSLINDPPKKLFYFNNVKKMLPFIPYLEGYNSFNELRLLNNSIKHRGIVSKELARFYPNWKVGDELKDLESDYNRLLPGVKKYVANLVEKIYTDYPKQS